MLLSKLIIDENDCIVFVYILLDSTTGGFLTHPIHAFKMVYILAQAKNCISGPELSYLIIIINIHTYIHSHTYICILCKYICIYRSKGDGLWSLVSSSTEFKGKLSNLTNFKTKHHTKTRRSHFSKMKSGVNA